jgi:hypothetical protein
MKKQNLISTLTVIVLAIFVLSTNLLAQGDQKQEIKQIKSQFKANQHVTGFVDANNDGYNDNAPDLDGDGIPNGRDEDYSGSKFRKGNNGSKGFVDLNGDGLNDNAFDSDGDGIPNGKDPDFVKPQDGTGQKNMKGKNTQSKFGGNKYGSSNGTGTGIGPKDGTGNGSGSGSGTGTGNCDGTGPKGNRGGRK